MGRDMFQFITVRLRGSGVWYLVLARWPIRVDATAVGNIVVTFDEYPVPVRGRVSRRQRNDQEIETRRKKLYAQNRS